VRNSLVTGSLYTTTDYHLWAIVYLSQTLPLLNF